MRGRGTLILVPALYVGTRAEPAFGGHLDLGYWDVGLGCAALAARSACKAWSTLDLGLMPVRESLGGRTTG